MSDETGRTRPLVSALAEGVRDDLADVVAGIETVRAKVEELGDGARAINGLRDDCMGWSNHLGSVLEEVRRAQAEVPAKLLGTPLPTITTSVNAELAEQVSKARRAS